MLSRPRPFPGLALVALLLGLALTTWGCLSPQAPRIAGASDGYLFCFWNVENLFDDRDDGRTGPGDKEYDGWFARDHRSLELKLSHLSEALLKLNDGKGPDILALVEVENTRAAELLQKALNQRLSDESLHYQHLLMKELSAGRHIAPAILTRLPVNGSRTQLHGRRQRILEGRIEVDGHELVILATHWTSRLTDKDGSHRANYADQIYGRFKGMFRSNPKVDVLICGDFNDPPDARSVTQHLHATGDINLVQPAKPGDLESIRAPGVDPMLLSLFAYKEPEDRTGTHFYQGKWFTFDQIVVSPGMLDTAGWSCDPSSAQIVNTLFRPGDKQRRPWRFGNEHDKAQRGYSDHFPVTVRLRVEP